MTPGSQDVAIATPPTIVAGAMWLGWSPDQWVVALTLLYLSLSILHKGVQMWRDFRRKR